MDRHQIGQIAVDVALINALRGAAIAKEMLGRGRNLAHAEKAGFARAALQAFNHRCAQFGDQRGIFRIAFIAAAPAIIARHGNGGGEGPVDPGYLDFNRSRRANAADQIRIASGTKRDIVRKHRRTDDIGVAVHRVGRPDGGNCRFAIRQGRG